VLAVNSVISVYYYLGIGRAMFVADEEGESMRNPVMSFGLKAACVICMVGIFGGFVLFSPILNVLTAH